jgi:hypothetical protein
MAGSGSAKRQLTEQVNVRMPLALKAALADIGRQAAQQIGGKNVTEATVARELILQALGPDVLATYDVPADLERVAQKRPPRPPRPEYIQQIAHFREVLGETNGSMRQSINLMKIGGRSALADEIAEFLPVLRAIAEETTALQRRLLADLDQDEAA